MGGEAGGDDEDDAGDGQRRSAPPLTYDLADWSATARWLLDRHLAVHPVRGDWRPRSSPTQVTVAGRHEAVVDDLIDALDGVERRCISTAGGRDDALVGHVLRLDRDTDAVLSQVCIVATWMLPRAGFAGGLELVLPDLLDLDRPDDAPHRWWSAVLATGHRVAALIGDPGKSDEVIVAEVADLFLLLDPLLLPAHSISIAERDEDADGFLVPMCVERRARTWSTTDRNDLVWEHARADLGRRWDLGVPDEGPPLVLTTAGMVVPARSRWPAEDDADDGADDCSPDDRTKPLESRPMPVMVCPACGSEYVSSVAVCPDDGTLLVESEADEMAAEIAKDVAEAEDLAAADLDPGADGDVEAGAQVAYELDAWDGASRVLLDQLLTGEDIVHVWEAGTLVIRAEDEERTDALVDQVEITTQPTLDPDKEQVVYEMEDWPEEKLTALADSLDEAEVPFGFDENGDLVIHEEDEEKVEPILDQVDFNFAVDAEDIASGEDDDEGEDDGLATQDTLSELFVAADRLMHDAKDKDGVLGLVQAAEAVARYKLPYGFAPAVWSDIVGQATALKRVLSGEDDEDVDADADDEVTEEALTSTDATDDAGLEDADASADDDEDDVDEDDDAADVDDEETVEDSDAAISDAARDLRQLLRQYV